VLVLAWAAAAVPAYADPVPGATYTGVAADGAGVVFTVSSDGTIVDSYRVTDVMAPGCQFTAEGDNGIWPGAAIVNNAFSYQLYTAIYFDGTFPGAQSASGTFRFDDAATAATAACDTGTVAWTATTTATPPSTGSGTGTGPGTGTGTGGGGHGKRTFATRVAFRKLSRKLVGGRVTSSDAACRADRTVILWRLSKRIGSTKSKAGGSFSFARSSKVRGHRVRASVAARTVKSGICAAGSSTFITG
jgi:hypothetical protein